MLCNIDDLLIEDARRILTLLCFAARPLTVPELIDGIAVEIEGFKLNSKSRLQDFNDIREICVGFVDIGYDAILTGESYYEEDLIPTVRIAHFSVQEYLVSERIQYQRATIFSLNSVTAHAEIAQICLVYLLEDGLSSSALDQTVVEAFPLAHFAAMYWYRHYRNTVDPSPGLNSLIVRLLQCQHSFVTWVMLHDMDSIWRTYIDFSRRSETIVAPVYYASLLGLDEALLELISIGQVGSTIVDVNAQGGRYGNALQAASERGHEKAIQILLDKGAEVNAQGGEYGNALQAASQGGHDKVIQILLDNGAEVNAQGGVYGNALQAASL